MKIHAIQTGQVQIKTRHVEARRGPRPARVLDVLIDRNWAPRLPISCYAIEHPDGLSFRGGLIVEHRDRFSFYGWARQALGPPGMLLGWTPILRSAVRRKAAAKLEDYTGASGQARP